MVKQLGGQNDRFQGFMDQIKDAYGEVRQVMEFAHVMMTLKTLSNTEELRDRTKVIIERKSLSGQVTYLLKCVLTEDNNRVGYVEQSLASGTFHPTCRSA